MSEDTATIEEPQVEEEAQLDQGEEQPEPEQTEPEEDEIIVRIGEQQPEEDEQGKELRTMPPWVKEIRRNLYHQKRENEKLQRELAAAKGAVQAPERIDPGPKPTLAACEYDEDLLNTKLDSWYEQKRRADEIDRENQRRQQQADNRWRQKMQLFEEKKQSLKVKDWEDIDLTVTSTLNPHQQAMIISGSDNPALLFYALGKNQKKIKELAALEDPIQFAFAVAKVEASLKVTERKPAVAPEKTIPSGGAPISSTDKTLERLRDEAARTGDNSKVMAYRRKLKEQSRRK